MTPKMKQCLDFLASFREEHGYAPSYEEIRVHMKMKSRSGVTPLIKKLEEQGYIKRVPILARSIRVVADPHPSGDPAQDSISAPPLTRTKDLDLPWDQQ